MNVVTLNLDKDFTPIAATELQFDSFVFAGGEPHFKLNSDIERNAQVIVTARIRSFNDLGVLCLAADAIRRMGGILETLILPYFPASRQDRVMVSGEALSVKVYADLINLLNFKRVVVYDAHSEVTAALVNNCELISNHSFIKKVIQNLGSETLLVSPDGGALKKIYKLSQFLGGLPVIECNKKRDVKTGKLSGFKVYSDDLKGADCLIVDDICDGGATFVGLAAELKKKNSGRLFLAVSHGIFSKGFEDLNCFDRIFTTDSFRNVNHELLTQLYLRDGLLS
ncbi:ribose-phosphate diphosphokinase [Flavobacterium sp.]|uniref:ribose-phosphate diphosphokinase n=1 Tax=Flavobacterium sp. TaxID=239 RepID=UPI00260B69F6|nr:ribose-phosphate diphosphokinase [Flavobacterium sp.]